MKKTEIYPSRFRFAVRKEPQDSRNQKLDTDTHGASLH
jgi:hypothetical protein